jgi:hypothetical protein
MSKRAHNLAKQPGPFTAWIVLEPAESIAGVWTSHALEFDLVSQGTSADDALRMAVEAVSIVLRDDLEQGLDPYRRRAPAEYWQQLLEIQEHGAPLEGQALSERLRESKTGCFAVMAWFMPLALRAHASEKSINAPLGIASKPLEHVATC